MLLSNTVPGLRPSGTRLKSKTFFGGDRYISLLGCQRPRRVENTRPTQDWNTFEGRKLYEIQEPE
jgi:hypothetical protein